MRYIFFNTCICLFSAPRGLTFSGQGVDMVAVKVASGDTAGVDHYSIAVKNEPSLSCNTTGSSCIIGGLNAATMYTVLAKACLSAENSGACGQAAEGSTWTKSELWARLDLMICL